MINIFSHFWSILCIVAKYTYYCLKTKSYWPQAFER